MEITVSICTNVVQRECITVDESSTYDDVLERFDINPETVVVLQNDYPQPFDKIVLPDGEITILVIASGG
ncbi:MAG: hypothetical protein EMLJLAPB_00940 [Candidatus Argoarchaeum ethanivorans]|uniref:Thiamine biosynthesis protein ThiS n=1 Tax=Candidatus Argoarchaeum ethanivorans TaxID=2608793 RepID=A0A811T7H1_9EURY|nr:MAG: hypothetical protein FFODKBPE_00477 [Candidatus Argoarchaeum ethanivorans]CAD6494775.1 MAG: hypothetical protein EMLJLAPB_00940 [Candidatus Argoarchaeum ethanivorans]